MKRCLTASWRCLIAALLATACWAGEPVTPANPNNPTTSVNPATLTPPATLPVTVADDGPSAWLKSFPSAQHRLLDDSKRPLLLWPPQRRWRGEVLLIPGQGNAVHAHSPLLVLASHLATSGWRCWLLARDDPTAPAPVEAELSQWHAVVSSEPAPTDAPAHQAGPLPRFLISHSDATQLAWATATSTASAFHGVVLLAAEALPVQAPQQPVLELPLSANTVIVKAAADRQQRWQHLPQYQQQWLTETQPGQHARWFSNAIDGWLRKIAEQQATAAEDTALKRQMTAQPGRTQ